MAHSVLNFSQNLTTTFALCHKIKFYACKFEKNLNKNIVILLLILPHFVYYKISPNLQQLSLNQHLNVNFRLQIKP